MFFVFQGLSTPGPSRAASSYDREASPGGPSVLSPTEFICLSLCSCASSSCRVPPCFRPPVLCFSLLLLLLAALCLEYPLLWPLAVFVRASPWWPCCQSPSLVASPTLCGLCVSISSPPWGPWVVWDLSHHTPAWHRAGPQRALGGTC